MNIHHKKTKNFEKGCESNIIMTEQKKTESGDNTYE